jgi:hypothetical protein
MCAKKGILWPAFHNIVDVYNKGALPLLPLSLNVLVVFSLSLKT